jgi:peptidoglycan/xylan/chitin deacetylase (PgdA/CDA1 family)
MCSDVPARAGTPLVSSDHVAVRPCRLDTRAALLSIDLETDYGTGRTDVLAQIPRFLDFLAVHRLPLTAFVEGQLFERHPDVCALLVERGVDVQLHVHDHATAGDTPDSLRRGANAYASFMHVRPQGYRAHTYRLTPALYEALVSIGFKWDSSIMRAYGLGRNAHACFRDGDYFVMGNGLVEFPVGTWRYVPLPLNHPYTLLAGSLCGRLLRSMCGPAGRLVAYNVHMTDLLRSPALSQARYGRLFEWLQRWMWLGHGGDTFPAFRLMCDYLRQQGFTFMTTSQLYRQVTSAAGVRPRAYGPVNQ